MHDVPESKIDRVEPDSVAPSPPDDKRRFLALVTPLRIIAAVAAVAALHLAAPVLIPVVLSVLLFYALDPLADWLERWRMPRLLASVLVVVMVVAGLAFGLLRLWPQVEEVVTGIPEGATRLRAIVRTLDRPGDDSILAKVREATEAIDQAAAEATPAPVTPGLMRVEVQQPWRASDWLWQRGVGLLWLAGQALTVLFLTIFLLNEDDHFKRKLVRQMGTLGSKRLTVEVLNDIAAQMKNFLWVQFLTSSIVAVATGVSLWLLGMEQAAFWGLFAGVLNIVPYFGPIAVTLVITVAAFLQFGTLSEALVVAGVALGITTLEGMFLTPHLFSRAASLNHVAIFLAIAFFGWTWGVPGVLLAVPILMSVKAVCDHVEDLKPIGDFLGE